MIAIILAAGTGTRLRPLTKNIPKALLELNKITIIERLVETLVNNNISQFIFVVGHFKDKVIIHSEYLEDKYNIKINIIENENYYMTNTSYSAYLATKDISDDFILINGDNILDPQIIRNIMKTKNSSMVIDNYKKLNEESFKIIIEDGIIKDIGKNLEISKSSGEFIGVSKVISSDLPDFNDILLKLIRKDSENYYDFAYEKLSKKTRIDFIETNGLKWTEIDDHADWDYAKNLIKEIDNP
ncbi:MAG: phosphocholine cytidylyltransferase family protein [Methanobrevibacter arboriphilus]|uniref:Uncharacterized protein n=2 Tax=Methanobrevibacter arboriphilus TaxID=39441 RepID=A0ACA8R4L5_METAZ|nr:phosphocholine cytidylyltransferase family protein [Methanobrevibacter arboriphilus]MBF4468026.1 phosphocholine cytidylyltransferase family protein [Methanobrevibacter arboriphilus]MCC7561826.1 phosphocholine cytidylyltransferase family protein [Methanobrevibacter arboriphilus]BBL62182.1 hypothetical protein MarbSA_12220 [Methanobrevibacter arboriphilus]GLI11786.1 hypothetical protein MARBORIA2_08760 [Methanobrevibacter arboriphilus]